MRTRMINKNTRDEIVILLLKRRKTLGQKTISPLDLYADFYWLQQHSGMILEEIVKDKLFSKAK